MRETEGISARIRNAMSELTPSERRVARALLARGPTFGLESSSSLAKHISVSGPTVSRFVTKLGFANYGDFQHALREEVQERITSPVTLYPSEQGTDDGATASLSTSNLVIRDAVEETLRSIPADELGKAAAMLADSRKQVLVFGGRFSHVVARHLVDLFQELRVGVRFVETTPHERLAALSQVNQRHVIVVVDFRRYERDTSALARGMHARGARVILITDPWLSPLAEIADVVFSASLGQPSPFDSLVPAMALVEVLMTSVVDAIGPQGKEHFEAFNSLAEEFVPSWGVRDLDTDPDLHVPTAPAPPARRSRRPRRGR
jgi:DNA-binding MurR/RpiR family transcriptional regulator